MGIGLSNGAYYDDEHHYASAKWDDKYDNNELDPEINDLHTEDNNVQSPPSRVEKNTDPQPVSDVTMSPDIEDRRDQTYTLKQQWDDGQVGRKLKDTFLGDQTPLVPEVPSTPLGKELGLDDIKLEKSVPQRSAIQNAIDTVVDDGNFIRSMFGKSKIDPKNFDLPEDPDLEKIAKLRDKLFKATDGVQGTDVGDYKVGGSEHYKDFRHSDNIDDRRPDADSLTNKIEEILKGKDVKYGSLTPRELENNLLQYSSEELVKLWKSGGPTKLAKALGFDDLDK